MKIKTRFLIRCPFSTPEGRRNGTGRNPPMNPVSPNRRRRGFFVVLAPDAMALFQADAESYNSMGLPHRYTDRSGNTKSDMMQRVRRPCFERGLEGQIEPRRGGPEAQGISEE